MAAVSVSPCVHPGCRDLDGNRRLTTVVMCDACRVRFRWELNWLVEDYVTLKSTLPTPARPSQRDVRVRHTGESFGHPAPDASDACSEIALLLNDIEARLRTHLGDSPGPEPVTAKGRFEVGQRSERQVGFEPVNDVQLVNHAYTYLSARFEQLCQWPDISHHAQAITDTHRTNRAKYGLTRYVERLPLPCPSCDVAALVRTPPARRHGEGPFPEVAAIACEACGRKLSEEEYLQHAGIRIAWELAQYEQDRATEQAEPEQP